MPYYQRSKIHKSSRLRSVLTSEFKNLNPYLNIIKSILTQIGREHALNEDMTEGRVEGSDVVSVNTSSKSVIMVCEDYEGLRGGSYYYVVEGNKLIHISRYSSNRTGTCYYVDLSRIRGKTIIMFSTSRSGPIALFRLTTEDLIFERTGEPMPFNSINDFEIEHLSPKDRDFLAREWDRHYRPMLNYVRNRLRWAIIIGSRLVSVHVDEDLRYPLPFLIPNGRSRSSSLNSLKKLIHQIWIVAKIVNELPATIEGSSIILEQGSYQPVARIGSYYLWYEFDLTPHTMCGGMLWHSKITPQLRSVYERALGFSRERGVDRISLRPDIVLTQARDCSEFVQNPRVDVIIECKNDEYEIWSKHFDGQIIAYKEIFLPRRILIASLKPVPQWVKRILETRGIIAIENVYPGGEGEAELIEFMEKMISSQL